MVHDETEGTRGGAGKRRGTSRALGLGSPLTTSFHHRTPRSPRILNLNLAFELL